MEEIFTRRSIRNYTNQEIEEEKIKLLLKAAMAAPSAGNEQPWQFIVVDDKQIMEEIMEFHDYATMLKEAPAAIVVCGDKSLEKYENYWVQDCAAATQNILLEAESEGLGAVWLGVHPVEKRVNGVRELFELPEQIMPFSIIALGYPQQQKEKNDRYLEERVHYNSWS
ncbi:MAG: nitroreductase family protein [Bacillota bacterium]